MPDNTEANTQNTDGETPEEEGQGNEESTTPTFETWLAGQDDTVKGLVNTHTQGLRTALDSERTSRKDLEKQLRALGKKQEKGSEAQVELTKLADSLKAATQRADFYEAAQKEGVVNLKLAYMAAREEGVIDDDEKTVDFDALRKSHPQLFAPKPKTPNGNAGNGTGSNNKPTPFNMTKAIRQQAGRG